MRAILLFPPNWSACVSGPHLALPLIAGGIAETGWDVETWDLSLELYRSIGWQPNSGEIAEACKSGNYERLDDLYFQWEDRFKSSADKHNLNFGLISGFFGGYFDSKNILDLLAVIKKGTVFTDFYASFLLHRLKERDPDLIGVTIASHHQLLPAIELLLHLRAWVPNALIVLGGGVVTRLRDSAAFGEILKLADKAVLFQGDSVVRQLCAELTDSWPVKDSGSRKFLCGQGPLNPSGHAVPLDQWPTPFFTGLRTGEYPGRNTLPYVSTRGCYWGRCPFCAIPAGWSPTGYAGSAPADLVVRQISEMIAETGIKRIKFVDEAFPPAKVFTLARETERAGVEFLWEAYARLEPAWEKRDLLLAAKSSGLRRLYFGLEVAPAGNRVPFGKNDKGNVMTILERCHDIGILVHLFCMVGHPGTSRRDAELTADFLITYKDLVNTADLVGFRLDRGTQVSGIRPDTAVCDELSLSLHYVPTEPGILNFEEVNDLELELQERIWEEVPRLLHPLYRIGCAWGKDDRSQIQKSQNQRLSLPQELGPNRSQQASGW